MARKLWLLIFLSAFFILGGVSCSSSPDEQPDDDVLAALDEADEDGDLDEGGDEDFDEDFGDEGDDSEEVAEGSEDEEGFDDEEFSEEDFGEEELAEEDDAEQVEDDIEQEFAEEEVSDDDLEQELEEDLDQEVAATSDELGESVEILNIGYVGSKNGGTIEIQTSGDATYTTRINQDTNQFIIEVQQATLKESLKRPYIMKEFDGPFKAVNAYQNSGSSVARIVVQMKELIEPVVQKEGSNILVIPSQGMTVAQVETPPEEPAPEPKEEDGWKKSYDVQAAARDEKVLAARTLDEFLTGSERYYGRPISIEVKDADIRDVINFIAEESGVNLVMSEGVEGKVTLKLRQIPWDQALIIVMRANNLGYLRQGSVLRISPLTQLQAEASAAAQIVESQKKLTPLKVKVIPISYAKVDDLPKQVLPFLTTDRGKVVADSRTSSLIITDTENQLLKVERLIQELDIPPAQVMIEGKVIEAAETFSQNIGVNWGLSGNTVTISDGGGADGGPIDFSTSLSIAPLTPETVQAAVGGLSLNVGTLDFLGDLNATLALAENDNIARIISSPRVVTMNKEKAEISQQGEVISVNSEVDDQGTIARTAVRTPVTLKLSVAPQITSEGSVIMDVEVQRQFAGPVVDPETLARAVNTREAKTKVLVRNGQTAVIGGIFQSDETTSESGLPGLRNIPVLGWLFKSKLVEKNKNELLIFLTPRLLNAKDQRVNEG